MTSASSAVARQVAAAVRNTVPTPMFGLVSDVDPVRHAVKVLLQPDGIESGWIPYSAGVKAGDLRVSCPPSRGQHVVVAPMEGDAEHLTAYANVFDDVVQPPTSPATGQPAQPGELLVMAGCGAPPAHDGRSAGSATSGAGWYHLTAEGFFAGAGNATFTVKDGSIVMKVGGCTATLSASGLSVDGGNIASDGTVTGQEEVKTSEHSLNGHVHTNGNNGANTGAPVG